MRLLRCLALLLGIFQVLSLDNGLAARPGLGWNSDYCANCSHPSSMNGFGGEHFIAAIAEYIAGAKQQAGNYTLQDLGFHYVNMDASWNLPDRDSHGQLVPDPALWPSGLNQTVRHVHGLGLGFGLYGDRGSMDCARHPGNDGHETADAAQYAAWQIDWYKTDSCYATADHAQAVKEYGRMRDALNATGRPIWFALCGWQNWYAAPDAKIGYQGGSTLGNSWRTGPDTGTGWTAVVLNIQNALKVAKYAAPGGWNDGSLQLTPGMGCAPAPLQSPPLPTDNCITDQRFRTQYSAWAMLAMNLLLVGNFSALNSYVMETWSNPEIVAINQDPLGQSAVLLPQEARLSGPVDFKTTSYINANMKECGGEPALQQWILNSIGQIQKNGSNVCLNVEGCQTRLIYDGCVSASKGCGPNEEFVLNSTSLQLQSKLPSAECVTVNPDRTLELAECNFPAPGSQRFKFVDGQLMDGSGLCLTASSPPPPPSDSTFRLGRRLSGDSTGAAAKVSTSVFGEPASARAGFALMLMNNQVQASNVSCAARCLTALGLDLRLEWVVRNVWQHRQVGLVGGSNPTAIVAELDPGGASQVFRITRANHTANPSP